MKTDNAPGKPRRRIWIAVLVVVIALGAWIGIGYVKDADEIAQLKRYTPHGSHYIDTALTGGTVKWHSKEIALWRVREIKTEFASLDDFKVAFEQRPPHPKANISVHHPALNLEKEEGRRSHERAEAILAFLSEKGYENAGVVAN